MSQIEDQDRYIPLEQAKLDIVDALTQFHPSLGAHAQAILSDERRLNIVEVPEGSAVMMQCRASGVTPEDIRNSEYYKEDFEKEFGPHFTQQHNLEPYAIIDYEYDGTANRVVYLAHELGHAIADDLQIQRGLSSRDYISAEAEEQAYFVQSIYTHFTGQPSSESTYIAEHKGELTNIWERAVQYGRAETRFEAALALPQSDREAAYIEALTSGKASTLNAQQTNGFQTDASVRGQAL